MHPLTIPAVAGLMAAGVTYLTADHAAHIKPSEQTGWNQNGVPLGLTGALFVGGMAALAFGGLRELTAADDVIMGAGIATMVGSLVGVGGAIVKDAISSPLKNLPPHEISVDIYHNFNSGADDQELSTKHEAEYHKSYWVSTGHGTGFVAHKNREIHKLLDDAAGSKPAATLGDIDRVVSSFDANRDRQMSKDELKAFHAKYGPFDM